MKILNWNLLKHPLNWLTVILMLYFAGIAATLALEALGIRPSTGADDVDASGNGTSTITGAGASSAGSILTGGSGPHPTFSVDPAPGISDQELAVAYW